MHRGLNIFLGSLLAAGLLIGLLFWLQRNQEVGARASKPTLIFYCAAGLQPPIERVAREYQKRYDIDIQLQYGGSGTLLNNLEITKTGDLYLAADEDHMRRAKAKGLVSEIIPLVSMTPVIAVKKGNPKNIRSLSDLLRNDVRVSFANPDAAAVGKVVREVLQKSGQWNALENNIKTQGVFKPTVFEVANDIKIGSTDAGVIWDSTAQQYPDFESIRVPLFEPVTQTVSIGVLTASKHPTEAIRFARYLGASDRGLQVFKSRGYAPVEGDVWSDHPEIILFSGGINRPAIEETLKRFQRREGVTVITNYNGCGILVGEMKAGKRPDAYFACDKSYMHEVDAMFSASQDISETDMVLLVRKGNPLTIRTLDDLAKPGVRVAVANEKYSALGGLTNRLLKSAGLYDRVKPNITYGDAPTADFLTVRVKTGREDVAVVYRVNIVNAGSDVDMVPIPRPEATAVQPIAVGNASQHKQLVGRLIEAIRTEESKARFEASGFKTKF